MFMLAALLEKIFKGFAIDADTKVIEGLIQEGEKKVFIVKKSIYYITIFSLFWLITILVLSTVNTFLFFYVSIFPLYIQVTLAVLLGINVIVWFFSIVRYLRVYDKNYGIFRVMTAEERKPILKK